MVTLICVIVTQQIERDGKRFAKGSQGLWLAVGATKLSFRKPWCPGPFAGLMALFNWVNWVCHFALGDKTSKENDEQFLFTCGQGIRECASCPCKCFLARLQWFMYIYIGFCKLVRRCFLAVRWTRKGCSLLDLEPTKGTHQQVLALTASCSSYCASHDLYCNDCWTKFRSQNSDLWTGAATGVRTVREEKESVEQRAKR